MQKGAIPVPYIVALILGIVIIALLGYWFFVLGGRLPGQATEGVCREKALVWCSEWSGTGYDASGFVGFSTTCGAEDIASYYAPECCSYAPFNTMSTAGPAQAACQQILGTA